MSTRQTPDRPTLPAPKMQMPPLDKDLPPLQIQPPGGNIGGEPVGPLAVPTTVFPSMPGGMLPGGPVELPKLRSQYARRLVNFTRRGRSRLPMPDIESRF